MRTYLLAPKRKLGRMACLTSVAVAALLSCALPQLAGAAGLSSSPDSGPAVHHDTSPPLLSLRPSGTPGQAYPARPTPPLPSASSRTAARDTSGGQAASPFTAPLTSPLMPSTSANFNGIGENACNCVPPDPSGAAGPSQYVEVANTDFAVYSKTGTALLGPEATNTLWSGFGGGCEKNNDGDGTVLFDTISQRWVVQQFSVRTTPYLDCVAVSETSDATGKWHRYSFQYEKFPDYPKMGVWPDAYYASFNLFTSGFVGAEACAFNRAAMLKGEAASQQCFVGTEKGGSSLLPATLDGTTQPPSGEPEWFVALSPTEKNALAYWKFHVDWSNPANTTFTGPTNLPVEAFSEACGGGTCIPQSETSQQLESLGDRLMFRLAYRNFGGHESMVVTHAVTAGSSVGMRWYELRPSSGSLTVYQQGTYAPDSNYRWMGSIAMDKSGDMALGYSVSSSSLHPQIRYTGRLVGDSLGTMPQGEATLYEGAGSQLSTGSRAGSRWGDYTEMSVDPSDDCTFWYVNEYLPSNGDFNWHTRIGSFKFPSCSDAPSATTEPATNITKSGATLNGTVNPEGLETKYYFEYGTSESYGTKTAEASAGSGTSNVKESTAITGLTAGTTYHFRIVASNSHGTTDGSDQAFSTLLFPNLAATDTFKRPDEAPLSNGGKWSALFGDPTGEIVAEKWFAQGAPAAARWNVAEQTNPAVSLTITETSQNPYGIWACLDAAGENGYFVEVAGKTEKVNLFRLKEGVRVLLSQVIAKVENGDSIGLGVRAGTVGVFRKRGGTWALLFQVSDSSFTKGYGGIQGKHGVLPPVGAVFANNFAIGEMSP